MSPEEKKLQEEIIKKLQFGAAEIIFLEIINAFVEFNLN